MKFKLIILFLFFIINLFSNNFDYYYSLANRYEKQRRFKLAEYYYQQAVYKDKYSFVAYNNLGNTQVQNGKYETAIKSYRKAIFINPHYSLAYSNLGIVFLHKSFFDRAKDNFDKAIQLDSSNHSAFYNLGKYYKTQKKIEKSIEPLLIAINLEGKNALYWFEIAHSHFLLGEYDKSYTSFLKSKKYDPQVGETYVFLGNIFMKKMERKKGIKNYKMAASLGNENAQTWLDNNGYKWKLKKKKKKPFWLFWKKNKVEIESDETIKKEDKKPFWLFWKKDKTKEVKQKND